MFKPSLNVQTKMFRRVKTCSPLSHENPPAVTSFLPKTVEMYDSSYSAHLNQRNSDGYIQNQELDRESTSNSIISKMFI